MPNIQNYYKEEAFEDKYEEEEYLGEVSFSETKIYLGLFFSCENLQTASIALY